MKIDRLLKVLLILTLLKGLVWAYLIPPFQSPDEQNHFAYVQYVAETGAIPDIKKSKNVSLELLKATQILHFDWQGTHPMWNKDILKEAKEIDKEISLIPKNNRKIFVSYANGFKYPPLYYCLGSIFYKIGSYGNIFDTLYMTRTLSVLFAVIAVFFSYKIAYLVTEKKYLSLTSAVLVSFQPSFTNITSTVTNDSMAIASVSLAVYLILKQNNLGILGGFIALITRIHLGILLIYSLFRKNLKILTSLILIFIFISPNNPPSLPFGIDKFAEGAASIRDIFLNPSIFTNVVNFITISIPHYLNEVFPWYLGVFGWLEITLPPIIYTVFKIIILLSITGFLVKRKNPYPKIIPGVISAAILFLVIFLSDFITFVHTGVGVGVQGRHLIPAISIHTLLLLIGLELIIPKIFWTICMKVLIMLMVIANFAGIYQIINYFYGSSLVSIFVNTGILITIMVLFLLTLLLFLFNVSKLKEDG